MLVRLGADPNAADATLVTPLIAAASNGHDAAVRALVTAAEDALDVDRREMLGCTALWAAAERGHRETALTLLSAGADPDAPNAFGRTALVAAALKGNTDLCLALLSRGANPNVGDEDGETALYVAAFEDRAETAAAMMSATRGRGRQPRKRRGKYAVDRRVLAREPRLRPRALETPP